MRIGIDVRDLSHGLVGGVHTYLASFVPELIDLAQDHQIHLYADTKRPFELRDLPPHVSVHLLPWRGALSKGSYDVLVSRAMARDRLDVVHFPSNYGFGPSGARTVITLHDAINILPMREIFRGHPKDIHTLVMMSYLHTVTRLALRRASLLLTVSGHARTEIARYSGFDPERILPIWHAPTAELRRIEDPAVLAEVRERYSLPASFVLADALKNPAALVRAWRLVPAELRQGRKIVFFARQPDVQPIVHAAVAEGAAMLLVRPSRPDLIALFSMAAVFVFPSWIEGFGLPVLEAMTCGAPVVASDRGSIPEVAGDAALLADAEDEVAFARHIALVLGDPATAADLRRRGFARAAQFTWRETARKILDSYHLALNVERARLNVQRSPFNV